MMGMWPMSLLRRWGAACAGSCTMRSRCKAPLYVRPCKPKPCEALTMNRRPTELMPYLLAH